MKYRDMMNSKPRDYGAMNGRALEVFNKYRDYSVHEFSEQLTREKDEVLEKVENAMGVLADAVNKYDNKDIAEAMFMGILKQHRTLQAQTVSAMLQFFKLYQGCSYDLRNWAAVVASEYISQEIENNLIGIPLI